LHSLKDLVLLVLLEESFELRGKVIVILHRFSNIYIQSSL